MPYRALSSNVGTEPTSCPLPAQLPLPLVDLVPDALHVRQELPRLPPG